MFAAYLPQKRKEKERKKRLKNNNKKRQTQMSMPPLRQLSFVVNKKKI
jgi:hypothetical protein